MIIVMPLVMMMMVMIMIRIMMIIVTKFQISKPFSQYTSVYILCYKNLYSFYRFLLFIVYPLPMQWQGPSQALPNDKPLVQKKTA